MPAYVRRTIDAFTQSDPAAIVGLLERAYAADGFASQYSRQTQAWFQTVTKLQDTFAQLLAIRPEALDWTVLLEFPLYRLRRRIDIVVLAGPVIVVVECKIGATVFTAQDRRQVEEYALDLRDFHAGSHGRTILPVLWCTDAEPVDSNAPPPIGGGADTVGVVTELGSEGLHGYLASLQIPEQTQGLVADEWDQSPYRPVPNVIEAATRIFARNDVRSIANADADNLRSASARLVALIQQARERRQRYLIILSGVPGSGKTLAGLDAVHSAISTGVERSGDIVYLSGNTPLVVVLREALARDERRRSRDKGGRQSLNDIRREMRARIQHINDFMQESLRNSSQIPPHEHVIVFDEAQRAWGEKHGLDKFDRQASEPTLLLELMSRHDDWCSCVCLIGGGQEINSGEEGVLGWGNALRRMQPDLRRQWAVFAPPDVLGGGPSAGSFTLGEMPPDIAATVEPDLQLRVSQRSYRSPSVSRWVDHVLAGEAAAARAAMEELHRYPVAITRSLAEAKCWLQEHGRGERRFGLLASSGARRLRADGLGVTLNVSAGPEIAHWYLNLRGDIRSSYAVEVPANEYTCQGLEIDFACICWGGDLLWNSSPHTWATSRLSGTIWQRVQEASARRYLINSYRVLLTRAREGMVLWIPQGELSDATRAPGPLDDTAAFLIQCGAFEL